MLARVTTGRLPPSVRTFVWKASVAARAGSKNDEPNSDLSVCPYAGILLYAHAMSPSAMEMPLDPSNDSM
jgi:hypothetical protein